MKYNLEKTKMLSIKINLENKKGKKTVNFKDSLKERNKKIVDENNERKIYERKNDINNIEENNKKFKIIIKKNDANEESGGLINPIFKSDIVNNNYNDIEKNNSKLINTYLIKLYFNIVNKIMNYNKNGDEFEKLLKERTQMEEKYQLQRENLDKEYQKKEKEFHKKEKEYQKTEKEYQKTEKEFHKKEKELQKKEKNYKKKKKNYKKKKKNYKKIKKKDRN